MEELTITRHLVQAIESKALHRIQETVIIELIGVLAYILIIICV